jgi:hypothetical protein
MFWRLYRRYCRRMCYVLAAAQAVLPQDVLCFGGCTGGMAAGWSASRFGFIVHAWHVHQITFCHHIIFPCQMSGMFLGRSARCVACWFCDCQLSSLSYTAVYLPELQAGLSQDKVLLGIPYFQRQELITLSYKRC